MYKMRDLLHINCQAQQVLDVKQISLTSGDNVKQNQMSWPNLHTSSQVYLVRIGKDLFSSLLLPFHFLCMQMSIGIFAKQSKQADHENTKLSKFAFQIIALGCMFVLRIRIKRPFQRLLMISVCVFIINYYRMNNIPIS